MQKTTSLSLPVIHSQTVEGMGKKVAQVSYYVYILASSFMVTQLHTSY